jgi:hypothetical protein
MPTDPGLPVTTVGRRIDKYGGFLAVGTSYGFVTIGGQAMPLSEARELIPLVTKACADAESWQAGIAAAQREHEQCAIVHQLPVPDITDKWWCDDEDCGGGIDYPHVHPWWGPLRPVDIDTGEETTPDHARQVAQQHAERTNHP